ncbi:ECF RNA polymerase sigma factor SigW [compost metagenome]
MEIRTLKEVMIVKDDHESALIKGIIKRDKESLMKLMDIYGKLIYYIAGTILIEPYEKEGIEDCYNEVFTAIWFNIDCFSVEKGSFKNWIIAITRYKAIDIKKKNLKYNQSLEYDDELVSNQENELERIENLELINELLNTLDKKDRNIFIKRYFRGDSIKEISKDAGYSEEYIYTRISRARKKLKKIVGEINE